MQRWSASREIYDAEKGDVFVFCELDEADDGDYVLYRDASAELTRLRAENEELRRDVIFASEHDTRLDGDTFSVRFVGPLFTGDTFAYLLCDGTDESIRATVRQARQHKGEG